MTVSLSKCNLYTDDNVKNNGALMYKTEAEAYLGDGGIYMSPGAKV